MIIVKIVSLKIGKIQFPIKVIDRIHVCLAVCQITYTIQLNCVLLALNKIKLYYALIHVSDFKFDKCNARYEHEKIRNQKFLKICKNVITGQYSQKTLVVINDKRKFVFLVQNVRDFIKLQK